MFKENSSDYLIELISDYKIFGNEIRIIGEIGTKLTHSGDGKGGRKPTTCISDFAKDNAFFQYVIGKSSGTLYLKSSTDKKLLLNKINITTSREADELLGGVDIKSCLRLFDSIKIPVNLHNVNGIDLVVPDGIEPFIIEAYPIMSGFVVCDGLIKELNERDIIWGLCDRKNTYSEDELDKNKAYVENKKNHLYYRIRTNEEELNSREKFISYVEDILGNWEKFDLPADTSGSLKNKAEVYKYLKIDGGYIPVSESNFKTLVKNNTSKSFKFRDAIKDSERLDQKINNGTSKHKFVKSDNKDAVVCGYSDSFIKDCLKRMEL